MNDKVVISGAGRGQSATLPSELMEKMGLQEGASLYVVKTDAGVLLTPFDPDLEESLEAFEVLNAKYSNVMRELAK
ncbi:MAG TPA: hypothetical protein VF584_17115 [Longimicrobium sp.]|jgi:bifunctional DNA-binding transcriptional regulator/antitoxin component of YhaV-PrlF toxin-antitoxin module